MQQDLFMYSMGSVRGREESKMTPRFFTPISEMGEFPCVELRKAMGGTCGVRQK